MRAQSLSSTPCRVDRKVFSEVVGFLPFIAAPRNGVRRGGRRRRRILWRMIVFRRSVIAMIGGRGKGVGWAASFFEAPVERSSFDVHAVSFVWTLKLIYLPVGKWGKFGGAGKTFEFRYDSIELAIFGSSLKNIPNIKSDTNSCNVSSRSKNRSNPTTTTA